MNDLFAMFDQQLLTAVEYRPTPISTSCKCDTKVCSHNNLQVLYPDLCKEWDTENNIHHPNYYLPSSNDIVSWKCRDSCSCHKWTAKISSRTKGSNSCPHCKHGKYCLHSNLTLSHPYLCQDWDFEKNKTTPDRYNRGSRNVVWWKCSNDHSWSGAINQRIYHKLSCPNCT